jgi:tetratricopeptide (TPR) repeat protein
MLPFKRSIYIIIVLLFALLNMYCGSNPASEAEKAFQSGNYGLALKLFLTAKAKNPQDRSIAEKIALAYMYRGQELYQKSNNIKSFSGNYDKALAYVPDNPSEEFKKTYSKLLLALAQGYLNSKPQNDIEREDFMNKAIAYMEDAIYNDQYNTSAESLLTVIKTENFQKMLDKGKDLYAQGKKQSNYDLYFSAEYYFKKACEFDIHNDEAKKLLSQVRKETLTVPNIKDDLALAIIEIKYLEGDLVLDITLRNHLADPVMVDLNNFLLTDMEGNTYSLDRPFMDSKMSGHQFKSGNVKPGDTPGILAFKVPSGKKVEYLSYKMSNGQLTKKYFP